ncbi:MAG: HD domain-containing protein [Bacteroidales bacterium]|jgi:HD superfamily phosphohydrolase|nr:HD domain-containing protein [Bacteroidales bacterium]
MYNKRKIINDPVYGFINLPFPILYDLIEHSYFQRLRRIKQLGLTSLVYPGANHTRFQHALGAMHLMDEAIKSLRSKGIEITDEEYEAALIAILLHDIGHGPFSHTLENALIENVPHEKVSLMFMQHLNRVFGGKLELAIAIFKKKYPKKFLCQLVSGQLDMDRMDYLRRDSFFTGVTEGIIGSDRIIKMLNVYEDELVIEAKGVYSIEKFLLARRLMYWQVYLHKTVISADQLLLNIVRRAKELIRTGDVLFGTPSLLYFLRDFVPDKMKYQSLTVLTHFAMLDDHDITVALKMWAAHADPILAGLSTRLLNRLLYRIEIQNEPFSAERIEPIQQKAIAQYCCEPDDVDYYVSTGVLSNNAYNNDGEESILVMQNDKPIDIAEASDLGNLFGMSRVVEKYFLCYPKDLNQ